jgi:hypothetical protein
MHAAPMVFSPLPRGKRLPNPAGEASDFATCRLILLALVLLAAVFSSRGESAIASPANRFVYLDENDPFYPHRDFPKLITPQWVGEPGVEAVVILSIDDMREPEKYEAFLRPVLERLKRSADRARLSIMTCGLTNTQAERLRGWLEEGLSLETHTLAHPCPLLRNGDFGAAWTNVMGCLDLMAAIPGNRPVAFRMPCCDSMNTPSPRFYAEIFSGVSPRNRFLQIDSSVMNITTTNDSELPLTITRDSTGQERFRKYLPFETNATTKVSMKSFATTIEDYPYPYVIGGNCWEFPCALPSDWEAFNLHGATNAVTLEDWKAGLDATVLKRGVFTLIFHPHGWSSPEQFVRLIDYAEEKYGKRVRFLNFRQALERLNENLLNGVPVRDAQGKRGAARILDVNGDGYMDVVTLTKSGFKERTWNPTRNSFEESYRTFETSFGGEARFGVLRTKESKSFPVVLRPAGDGVPMIVGLNGDSGAFGEGLRVEKFPHNVTEGNDSGIRFRDVDGDGSCELIISNPLQNSVFKWSDEERQWQTNSFSLPPGISLVDGAGRDNGVRFVDVNQDGFDDVLVSNSKTFELWLFIQTPKPHLGWARGWTFPARRGKSGDAREIPMISRGGDRPNSGAWFKNGTMWVQNENTATLPDQVDRRTFVDLMLGDETAPKSVDEALKSFQLAEGFQIECVASEPLIVDPVSFDWDLEGRLWVAEMKDYPLGNGGVGGSIKILEDTDGDGRYDRATSFLEGLHFPNGTTSD